MANVDDSALELDIVKHQNKRMSLQIQQFLQENRFLRSQIKDNQSEKHDRVNKVHSLSSNLNVELYILCVFLGFYIN